MTPAEFKSARKELGLSARKMAEMLGLKDQRTIRRYESGEIEISGPVAKLTRVILEGMRGIRRAQRKLGGAAESVALASSDDELLQRANLALADILRRAGIDVEIVRVEAKGSGTAARAAEAGLKMRAPRTRDS